MIMKYSPPAVGGGVAAALAGLFWGVHVAVFLAFAVAVCLALAVAVCFGVGAERSNFSARREV